MCLQPEVPAIDDSTPALPNTSVLRCALNVGGSHNKLIWTTPQCMPLQTGQHYVPDVGKLQCILIQMIVVLVYFDYCAVM